ncbi:hypothetical protein IK112_03075 [Candidatus Saccharibacteria bacterium]|nr:hypothetical protein [Candidatus Saccharibacteria bacterium]
MSKSTKIIAALGVVAGLGVAALPMATFATYTPKSVSADADIYVEIPEAIAMTITGNNDNNGHVAGGYTSTGADVFNPIDGSIPSVDTHAFPQTCEDDDSNPDTPDVCTYAPVTASSSWTQLTQNSKVDGDGTNGFKSDVTVYTNAVGGYDLTIASTNLTPESTASYKTYLEHQEDATKQIAAGTTISAGTSNWAYKVATLAKTAAENNGSTTADAATGNYTAITTSAVTIDGINTNTGSTGAAQAHGRTATVYYGVSTAADQAAGLYKTSVTYTATTKQKV